MNPNMNMNRPPLQPAVYGTHSNQQLMTNAGMMSNVNVSQSMPSMHSQPGDLNQSGGQMTNSVTMNTSMGQPSQHVSSSMPTMVPMSMNSGLNNAGIPNQPPRELPNGALVCRLGQETVQEIVFKTTELFNLLKVMHLPNGTQLSISTQEDKKAKVQDVLKVIANLFKRVRRMYERCNEACSAMEYIQIESLIPWREDCEMSGKQSQDDKKLSDNVKYLTEEHRGYVEQLRIRNRHIKELIDNLRSIVWEINTMLAMRKP